MKKLPTYMFLAIALLFALPAMAQSDDDYDYYNDELFDDPCHHASENNSWALDVWIADATLTDDLPVMANRLYTHLDSWFAIHISSTSFNDRIYALRGIGGMLIEDGAAAYFAAMEGTWDAYAERTDYPGQLQIDIADATTRWEWATTGTVSFGYSPELGEEGLIYTPLASQAELADLYSYLEGHGRSLLRLRLTYNDPNGIARQIALHQLNIDGFTEIVSEGEMIIANNAAICDFPEQ